MAASSTRWHGFEQLNFVVNGRDCVLVLPHSALPGNPWIWRTEFFGHEPQADVALLAKGFHVAYMDVKNMFGAPVAIDHMDAFYAHVTKQFGLARKMTLEGFSRGGLYAFNFAARNPQEVAAIYVDAPVCDLKSWPGGMREGKSRGDWERMKQVYGFGSDADALAAKVSPIDHLDPLAKARIPILSICGDADTVVPFKENTRVVEARYKALGGDIQVIIKTGADHHPHSLPDPTPIVDFVIRSSARN